MKRTRHNVTHGRRPVRFRGYLDMSNHNAFHDAGAEACDALLAALREHHAEPAVEATKRLRIPVRLSPPVVSCGSPAAMCADLGGAL